MRRSSWADLLISVLNISPGQIASIMASAGLMTALAWDYLGLIAIRTGPIAYVVAILMALVCGIGVVTIFLFVRGDLAWRRQVIAEMRQIDADRFNKMKEKYTKLATDIAIYFADTKQNEPVSSMNRDERATEAANSNRYRNQTEAKFIERFSARIIDLRIDMQRAGAMGRMIDGPIWSCYQWPDNFIKETGIEIARLEPVYDSGGD